MAPNQNLPYICDAESLPCFSVTRLLCFCLPARVWRPTRPFNSLFATSLHTSDTSPAWLHTASPWYHNPACPQVSGDPRGFDLTGDGERWEAAGGDEISEAAEFPTVLYEKWVDVLGQAAEHLEWEPTQWEALWKNLQKWGRGLARAGLDFGSDTGMAELQDIIETYASGAPKQRKRKAPAEEGAAEEAAAEAVPGSKRNKGEEEDDE